MSHIILEILVVGAAIVCFLFYASHLSNVDKALTAERMKLREELLQVSLLVSQRAPTNETAHLLVIQIAQCLGFPGPTRHYQTTDDDRTQLENARSYLDAVRDMCK